MFWLRMMKHLAEIAHVEVLTAHGAMLEMLRLGLDRPVVVPHLPSRSALAAFVRADRSLSFFLISLLTWLGEMPFSRAKCSTS
jgi:hypothetical protein